LTADLLAPLSSDPGEIDASVREALDRLPLQQSQMLTFIHIYGFSHAEVAAIFGTTVGAVKTAAWRAREAFTNVYVEGDVADE
jgi:DNA-directed RNA polymerase specialized sigma24 family protein